MEALHESDSTSNAADDALATRIFAAAHQCAELLPLFDEDRHAARDLAQDVGLELLDALRGDRWKGLRKGDALPLVLVVLERRMTDRLRASMAREELQPLLQHALRSQARSWMQPDEMLETQELDALRERALASLGPACREVFTLVRDEEATYREVAERLGLTIHTIESHMTRAHGRFRCVLRAYGIDPPVPHVRNGRGAATTEITNDEITDNNVRKAEHD